MLGSSHLWFAMFALLEVRAGEALPGAWLGEPQMGEKASRDTAHHLSQLSI